MIKKSKTAFRLISCFAILLCIILFCSSCGITVTPESAEKQDAENIKKLEQAINKATLQYPTRNDEFYYNVYDTHVAITKYIGESEDVVVPSQIENLPVYVLGAEAFNESKVTKVTIEEGVLIIEDACFRKAELLETIRIPDTVFKIGENAFEDCISLSEITFPKLVSRIARSVCSRCTALKTVKILSTQTNGSIEDYAFGWCTALNSVYITKSISKITPYAFTELPETVVFYGPAACAAAEYCADNFYGYTVETSEKESSETSEPISPEADNPEQESESAETENDSNETEDGSVWSLIIVALVFFGIIGGLIAFLIIRRRRGY